MKKRMICSLALAASIPALSADSVQMFPSGTTKSTLDGKMNLRSVVGLPFGGTTGTSKDASIIYSGYLKMPIVYSVMFNEAPKFISEKTVTVPVGSKWAYTANAIDPEQDPLTYKYLPLPAGFYVDAANPQVIKIESMPATNAEIKAVVTDAGGLSDTLTLTVVAKKELLPLQILASSVSTKATEDEVYVSAIKTNYDGITDDSLAFDMRLDVAPAWLKLQKNSAGQFILAGTPLNGAKDTSVILSAYFKNKPETVAALLNFKIAVTPVNDAPVLATVTQFTAIAGTSFTTTMTATDVDDAVLTYELTTKIPGLTMTPAGVVTWTPDPTAVGKDNRFTVIVKDAAGASDTKEYVVAVTPPGVPVCQSVGPIAPVVSGLVTIPYVLADAESDPLSFTLELLHKDTLLMAIPATALTGAISTIAKTGYSGSIVWNSALTLPGIAKDSLRIRLTPSDALAAGVPAITTVFKLNNTPAMQVTAVSPKAAAVVTGYEGSTIGLTFGGTALDTASFTDRSLSVVGSVSKSFTYKLVSKSTTGATIQLNNQPASGETVTVTLTELPSDISGKKMIVTAPYTWSYKTALLSDFDKNGVLANIEDVALLSTYWNQSANSMLAASAVNAIELAPAAGTAPYLRVTPDNLFDYKDLVSFLQMWTWSFNGGVAPAARSVESLPAGVKNYVELASSPRNPSNSDDTIGSIHSVTVTDADNNSEVVVSLDGAENVQAGEYKFWYDPKTVSFAGLKKSSSILELNGGQLFDIVEEGDGYLRIARTRLSKQSRGVSGDGVILALDFHHDKNASPITMQYTLLDQDQKTVDAGVKTISPKSILKPNGGSSVGDLTAYPNPALPSANNGNSELSSNLTNLVERARSAGGVVITIDRSGFGKDVKSAMIDLQIRDALGNLVMSENGLSLNLEDAQCFGYYWSGHNNQNRAVASGVYQVSMKWKSGDKSGIAKTVIGIRKDNAQ